MHVFNHVNSLIYSSLLSALLLLSSNTIVNADAIGSHTRGLDWDGSKAENTTPFLTGQYHALVIGNDTYKDDNGVWKDLETATNDARRIAAILKSEYGFHNVKLLLNTTRREILKELNELSDTTQPNDSVLIYYAGHGHLENAKKRGYWIPSDAVGGDNSTYLRNSTIRDEINIIADRSLHTLVISDSCFSGALMRADLRGSQTVAIGGNYYKKIASKKSVQVLAAGGTEFVDDSYRNSGHSPFTYFLLAELISNEKRLLSLNELATNVSIAVANNVEQTPETGVLLGSGDELGQFVFKRNTGQSVVVDSSVIEFSNDDEEDDISAISMLLNDDPEKQIENMKEFVLPAHTL